MTHYVSGNGLDFFSCVPLSSFRFRHVAFESGLCFLVLHATVSMESMDTVWTPDSANSLDPDRILVVLCTESVTGVRDGSSIQSLHWHSADYCFLVLHVYRGVLVLMTVRPGIHGARSFIQGSTVRGCSMQEQGPYSESRPTRLHWQNETKPTLPRGHSVYMEATNIEYLYARNRQNK